MLLRIEDHDRVRSRPEYETALLEDLAWLGFTPDLGPVRQSEPEAQAAFADAAARLQAQGLVYGCDCSRGTFAAWERTHDGPWTGPGCHGRCRERSLDGPVLRVALGEGTEAWSDVVRGPLQGPVAVAGDLTIRDRDGHWTYGFCVVVDDQRQGVELVVRGEDLLHATPAQIRLARMLGRSAPPVFLHHPLVLRPDGLKLSKSAGDTGVRELRAAGRSPDEVRTMAAAAIGGAPV